MRKLKCLIVIGLPMLVMGCYQWPSFCIGDSNGWITYDRNTRKLEVLWEKHIELKDSSMVKAKADTITARSNE